MKSPLIEIEIEKLLEDSRNPNMATDETLAKLAAHIQRSGHYPPLIVRAEQEQPGYYRLLDGHQRKKVLEKLGHRLVQCQVWDVLTDEDAQLYLATLNRLRGEDNPRKRAELLSGLMDAFSLDNLLPLIPESQSQLDDLLSLLSFESDEVIRQAKEQLAKEEAEMPVLLHFLLSKSQAQRVKDALSLFQPEETEDPSLALLALCESVHAHPTSED